MLNLKKLNPSNIYFHKSWYKALPHLMTYDLLPIMAVYIFSQAFVVPLFLVVLFHFPREVPAGPVLCGEW